MHACMHARMHARTHTRTRMHRCTHARMHARTHARRHHRYEVMPGEWDEIMPNLEKLIKTGTVQGSWPAARDEWGVYASKLETVLLVEIPAQENRSADRVVPGRDDVYVHHPTVKLRRGQAAQ